MDGGWILRQRIPIVSVDVLMVLGIGEKSGKDNHQLNHGRKGKCQS